MNEIFEEEASYNANDGTHVKCFMAGPKDMGAHPAVIVIQEIWGLTDFIRDVSRLLSSEGYYTIAPHLYSRKDLIDLLTEENIVDAMRPMWSLPPEKRNDREAIAGIMAKMNDTQRKVAKVLTSERASLEESLFSYISDAYAFIRKKRKATKTGIVGFCMGGGLSFQASTMIPFDATVVFYGVNPKPIEAISKIKGEVLGIYAGEDEGINGGLPELLTNVVKHKVRFQLNFYPGTHHAFFNHSAMSYHKEAAELARAQMLSFFSRTLGGEKR